jgi:repressor LexA
MAHTPPGRTRERVYRFVQERLLAGRPPTVREVQEAMGFRAVQSAQAHLAALVEDGRLARDGNGASRGLRLPDAVRRGSPVPVFVPVLGRVQAGALTLAVEDAEEAVAVQTRAPADGLFALRVRGDSMRGAGILEGDVVIVRRQDAADDGRIVVAMVGEEATVKRLRRVRLPHGGTRVELHAENPDFAPIVLEGGPDAEPVRILGRVIEVRRVLDDGDHRAPPRRRER